MEIVSITFELTERRSHGDTANRCKTHCSNNGIKGTHYQHQQWQRKKIKLQRNPLSCNSRDEKVPQSLPPASQAIRHQSGGINLFEIIMIFWAALTKSTIGRNNILIIVLKPASVPFNLGVSSPWVFWGFWGNSTQKTAGFLPVSCLSHLESKITLFNIESHMFYIQHCVPQGKMTATPTVNFLSFHQSKK